MKIKSFFTALMTVFLLTNYSIAANLTQQSVSEEAYKSTMGLMDQVTTTGFIQEGFTQVSREKWETTIDNLAAYFKKTRSLLISQANVALFNNSIKELKASTKELFDAVDFFVTNGQHTAPKALASKMEQVAAYMPTINQLLDKLKVTSGTDFKGTKDLKALFTSIVDSWQQILVKAHAKMHAFLASKETTARKAQLEAELQSTDLPAFFINQISWVKVKLGEKPSEQGPNLPEAAQGLDAITSQLVKGFDAQANNLKRSNYLQMIKSLDVIKELYAKLPPSLKQKTTEETITKYTKMILEKLQR